MFFHVVWATHRRQPLLTPERERAVHRCIESEARKLCCDVLAIGGMPDHVHLAVSTPTTLAVAQLMKQVKGVSSAFANRLQDQTGAFRWQEGFAVFTVSRSHVTRVVSYIKNQKRRHETSRLWPEWEETGEEAL
jgi:REP element-mobilizing transposase RayT